MIRQSRRPGRDVQDGTPGHQVFNERKKFVRMKTILICLDVVIDGPRTIIIDTQSNQPIHLSTYGGGCGFSDSSGGALAYRWCYLVSFGTGEGERSVLSLVQVVRLVRFEIMLHSLDTLAGKLSPGGSTQNSPQSSLLDNNANRVRPYSKPPSNSNT
ncbi:hypothetical protein QE152_g881 [Popillia japonica]|uniref:Uncharacterized protein n=1 Tax=Popillia japonica TaxID=7064 RepID=A0AAW1NAI0_POPJA